MSEPIRYSAAGTKIVETDPAGPLVEYIDYAILKAEFDEYRKAATIAADSVIDERNHLKAEVERLRKAGDALAENFKVQTWPWTSRFNCYLAWNAAKEGKQP